MLHILNISIQNFLTIGNLSQAIDLSVDGLTLILGENADVGVANSRNGVGKTALLQAISYGLFGKPLTKIRLDNLVNNINSKGMSVTIDFEANGKPYRIERGRKPNVLRFFVDGKHQKEFDESQGESRHTQTEIERLIGMSYIMFRHIVALNTSTTPFLREEAAVQREVIEELFGITQLSQRAEALKRQIDQTKDQVRDAEATVKANVAANARIDQAIERAKDEAEVWRTAHKRRVIDLTTKAEALFQIDFDHELAIFDQIDQWRLDQSEIEALRKQYQQRIEAAAQEITRVRQEIAQHEQAAVFDEAAQVERLVEQARTYREDAEQGSQAQIERLHAEFGRRLKEAMVKRGEAERLAEGLADIQHQLAHPDKHKCTTCGQSLSGTDHLATAMRALELQRDYLEKSIGDLLDTQEKAEREAAQVQAEISRLQQADQERRASLEAKAAQVDAEIKEMTTRLQTKREAWRLCLDDLKTILEGAQETKRALTEQHDSIEDEVMPQSSYASRDAVWQLRQEHDLLVKQLETELATPNPLEAKIDGLQSTLVAVDYGPLNELSTQQKHEQFLLKLLTAKDSFIRKRLIDQNLNYLNKRLNYYLERLGLPHEVVFQPDLTVEIALLGREFDFEQLSRGEMNRVILANSWSFRDCWESLNTNLNLLFVDEMLDQGTDGAGVEAALDILLTMAGERRKSVYLVSHREELRDRIDHVLTVRKENQFTTIS